MAKQIIDVQYVQVLDRLYVFETEPFEIQYGSDVTRVYVVDECYEGFKEINPNAPLKTFNPEAIQVGYPEWYEYVLSVIDSESNSELLAILYDAGLIANESYATLAEIRAITSSQFADAFATASTLTHFDEFEMFTGVKKLPDYMFQGCPNLESITFPESVYKLGKNVLAGCNSLDSVKVDGNNPKYYSPEGSNLIVDKTTRTIVAGCGNSTIPNDVYYIGDYAFANSDLTDIVIPKNIREIGDHAFDGCSALEYAEFESTNPPKIGSDVFDNVQPDFEIDVPEGAEGDYVDAWPEYADLIHGGEPQPHPEDLPDSEFGLESSDITITNSTMGVIIPLVNTHDLPVTYASSDTSVAVVDQSGVVTLSYNNGNANLTVAFAGSDEYKAKTLTYRVTVAIPQNLTDQEFGLSSSSITIDDESDTVTLPLINIYNLPVTYTSSNQNVAIVSNNGSVTLTYANGSANITISFAGNAQYTAKTLTYEITVAIPQELSDAELSWSASSATATQTGTFSGVTLTNTHHVPVTFASSDENVASIEPTYGHIMVTANGSTTISAVFAGNAEYKPKTVTYTLTVAIPQVLPDSEFGLSSTSTTVTTNPASVTIPLINTHNLPVTYTSDDTSIASVDGNGNVTLTYTDGTAHISIAFAGNEQYKPKTLTYTVNVAIPQELSDQELGLSSEGITIYDSSETVTLPIVNVYNLPLTYTSDDTRIASVDGNGNVTLTYENGRANIYIEFAGNAQYAEKILGYWIDVDIEEPAVYTLKYNVELPDSNFNNYRYTKLFTDSDINVVRNRIDAIKVDDVVLTSLPSDGHYVFQNAGKHSVEVAFKDPTIVNNGTDHPLMTCLNYYGGSTPYYPADVIIAEGVETLNRYSLRSDYFKTITLPSTITNVGTRLGGSRLVSLVVNATTPPDFNDTCNFIVNGNSAKIYVPDESLGLYNSDGVDGQGYSGWGYYGSYNSKQKRIYGIESKSNKPGNITIYYGKVPATPTRNLLMSSGEADNTYQLFNGQLFTENNEFDSLKFNTYVTTMFVGDNEIVGVTSDTYTFAYSYAYTHNANFTFAYNNRIPDNMFAYCDDIQTAYMEKGMTYINAYAFNQCRNLESVYLPETVTYIGTYAFYNEGGISISYFDMTSYNPPVLGDNVFGESTIEVIHVPEERVSYYKEAPGWSDYSENINPEPVQINYVTAAFNVASTPQIVKLYNNGSNIKSIEVDGRLEEGLPPSYGFETTGRHEVKYELLDDTILPGGSSSKYRIFEGCPFDELYLPDSITTIGDSALTDLNITELEIPKNVTTISNNLGSGCNKLTSLVIRSEYPLSIGQGLLAFNNTIAVNLTLPQSLRSLGLSVYYSAKKPSYVSLLVTDMASLHKNLACEQIKTQINKQVRLVDENLNEIFDVVIPEDTVDNPSIAAYAFYKCSRLKTITFNNATPPTLGTDAFGNMTALTAIYVPKNSVDAYKAAWSSYANIIQAIPDPTVVATVNVNDTTTEVGLVYSSQLSTVKKMVIDGETLSSPVSTYQFNTTGNHQVDIYMKDNTTIPAEFFAARNNRYTSIVMDDTVSSIGDAAFRDCSLLTSFEVPSLVTTLGSQAFQNCTSLTTVVLPNGFLSLGNWTLQGCSALANINLPEGMTSLGYTTLRGTALTSITIPSTMTNITTAFQYCNSLAEITCLATTPPTLNSGGLDHDPSLTRTIYVPAASVDVYKAASNWSNYANIIQAIPQAGYTINYTLYAVDTAMNYTPIISPRAFEIEDPQSGEVEFSIDYFNEIVDSITVNGVELLVETADNLMYDFSSSGDGLYDIELVLNVDYVPSNIFSNVPIYECHVGEGITVLKHASFAGAFSSYRDCKVYLPSTITTIEAGSFTMNSTLSEVHIDATTPPAYSDPDETGENIFDGVFLLYVPTSAEQTYKTDSYWSVWKSFININFQIEYWMHVDDSDVDPDTRETSVDLMNDAFFYSGGEWSESRYNQYISTNIYIVDSSNALTSINFGGEGHCRWATIANVDIKVRIPLVNQTTIPENLLKANSNASITELHIGEGVTETPTLPVDPTEVYLPSTITTLAENPFGYTGDKEFYYLIINATTPPTAPISGFLNYISAIYVPDEAVQTYKTGWASYASNIYPMSESGKRFLHASELGFYVDTDTYDYSYEMVVQPGNQFTVQSVLINEHNLPLTYNSDASVATVNANGVVTVTNDAAGGSIITIAFAGNDKYFATEVHINLTIEVPE